MMGFLEEPFLVLYHCVHACDVPAFMRMALIPVRYVTPKDKYIGLQTIFKDGSPTVLQRWVLSASAIARFVVTNTGSENGYASQLYKKTYRGRKGASKI